MSSPKWTYIVKRKCQRVLNFMQLFGSLGISVFADNRPHIKSVINCIDLNVDTFELPSRQRIPMSNLLADTGFALPLLDSVVANATGHHFSFFIQLVILPN